MFWKKNLLVIYTEDMSIADYTKIWEWNKNTQFQSIEIIVEE